MLRVGVRYVAHKNARIFVGYTSHDDSTNDFQISVAYRRTPSPK